MAPGFSYDTVHAVADFKGVDPLDLEPLSEWIDPEGLDALLQSSHVEIVRFEYAECIVTIDRDGIHIEKFEIQEPETPEN